MRITMTRLAWVLVAVIAFIVIQAIVLTFPAWA